MTKRGRPKTTDRIDVPVKVGKPVVLKAKAIADHRGIAVAELLTGILQKPIDQAYMEMLRELELSVSEPEK